ncbi:MAG: glycosyltransferase family 4 protein, partial [Patescibacteria group bacterium]|nr:glycosyltransferase family 4 protein [Patescibacteria group bacterium]
MRILLVTHYYADHRGGVEIIAGELARRLAGNDCSITWAASGPEPEEAIGRVEYLPMRALNVTERLLGVPYPVWGPRSLARLSEAARGCTLVHVHDSLYAGNLFAYLSARRRGTPVVVTQHIGLVPYRVRPLRWLMSAANRTVGRMVLSGAAQTVFYSRNAEDYFSRFVRFR